MSVRIDRVAMIAEMARADLSVKRLAELSGLSRGTITSVKTGKSCSQETADKLAAGLGVSVADIIEQERIQPTQTPEKRVTTDPHISAEDWGFCTNCGMAISRKWNYCPNCGAAVQGGRIPLTDAQENA